MEGSIEMKMQALDKMLEHRKQLVALQIELGMWNDFDERDSVLIFSVEDFFLYANHIGAKVTCKKAGEDGSFPVKLEFSYKEALFTTYTNFEKLPQGGYEIVEETA